VSLENAHLNAPCEHILTNVHILSSIGRILKGMMQELQATQAVRPALSPQMTCDKKWETRDQKWAENDENPQMPRLRFTAQNSDCTHHSESMHHFCAPNQHGAHMVLTARACWKDNVADAIGPACGSGGSLK